MFLLITRQKYSIGDNTTKPLFKITTEKKTHATQADYNEVITLHLGKEKTVFEHRNHKYICNQKIKNSQDFNDKTQNTHFELTCTKQFVISKQNKKVQTRTTRK